MGRRFNVVNFKISYFEAPSRSSFTMGKNSIVVDLDSLTIGHRRLRDGAKWTGVGVGRGEGETKVGGHLHNDTGDSQSS